MTPPDAAGGLDPAGRLAGGGCGRPDADDPAAPPSVLQVVPWDGSDLGDARHDVRSAYVELFWLPVLGPTATWLLRRLADRLDTSPDGFHVDLDEVGRMLGVGGLESRHAPLRRAIRRCVRFGVVRRPAEATLAVRGHVGAVLDRQLLRLPPVLRTLHEQWDAPVPDLAQCRRQARLLAIDLAILGEDRPGIERRLLRWGAHPAIAYESAAWGSARPAFDA